MTAGDPHSEPLRAVIAGGGVAALEAAAALHALAADRVAVTVLAPESEFTLRYAAIREPFTDAPPRRYALDPLLADLGAERCADRFKWVDTFERTVHTGAGDTLQYDVLLLALGARERPRFHHAVTLTSDAMQERIRELLRAVDAGSVGSVAFIVPSQPSWPLPLYELALMTADYAADRGTKLQLTLITPEDAPLAILGDTASREVARVLAERDIAALTSQHCQVHRQGQVSLHPSGIELQVDSVIALPELFGPSTPGIPTTAVRGFISVKSNGAVRGVPHVYAAGDATDRAVKHGSVAAEQADVAATAIAALAGVPVDPHPSRQSVHALLLGGGDPLFIRARLAGEHGVTTEVGRAPLWQPPHKLYVPYLEPHLEALAQAQVGA